MSDNLSSGSYISLKDIYDENFQDYKKASMLIACIKCDFKCCREFPDKPCFCHNLDIIKKPDIAVLISDIFERYISNYITSSIVFGGLEPFMQFEEIFSFIKYFRSKGCNDDMVIYTGYYDYEIKDKIERLRSLRNIVVKYGRFIPDSKKKYDEILGIELSSENQYAERIC